MKSKPSRYLWITVSIDFAIAILFFIIFADGAALFTLRGSSKILPPVSTGIILELGGAYAVLFLLEKRTITQRYSQRTRVISRSFLILLIAVLVIGCAIISVREIVPSAMAGIMISPLTLFVSTWWLGKRLNKRLNFKVKHGIVAVFSVLLITLFIGCTVVCVWEMVASPFPIRLKEYLFDYYFIPSSWILSFGGFPTLVSGLILGSYLKRFNEK